MRKLLFSISLVLFLGASLNAYFYQQSACSDPGGANCPCTYYPPGGGEIEYFCNGSYTISSTQLGPLLCAGAADNCEETYDPIPDSIAP